MGRFGGLIAGVLGAAVVTTAPAALRARAVRSEARAIAVEDLAGGLHHPWGMTFLPDGRLLVTERVGRLRILDVDGTLSPPLEGVPAVYARGHAGLLDVALDPAFASNRLVHLSFAERRDDGASIAVARGRLAEGRIADSEVIFREEPSAAGNNQFGGRIAFSPGGDLFVTMGDRFRAEMAQDLSSHLGTVVRIRPDGSVPADNPFVDRSNARTEIWTCGHRNVGAAAVHPGTGGLWIAEMGPRGGDELNVLEPGRNHGGPVVGRGGQDDGADIPHPPSDRRPAGPLRQWTPAISPSGMVFYTGDRFPEWRGSLLIGGLSSRELVRLSLEGRKVTGEERIPLGVRVRDVAQAPDGSVYLLTDAEDGHVRRLSPHSAPAGC